MDAQGKNMHLRAEHRGEMPKMVMYLGRKWLTRRTHALEQVCEMAGMEDGMVERLLREEGKKYGYV